MDGWPVIFSSCSLFPFFLSSENGDTLVLSFRSQWNVQKPWILGAVKPTRRVPINFASIPISPLRFCLVSHPWIHRRPTSNLCWPRLVKNLIEADSTASAPPLVILRGIKILSHSPNLPYQSSDLVLGSLSFSILLTQHFPWLALSNGKMADDLLLLASVMLLLSLGLQI